MNPTLSEHPVLSLSERLHCHFLQLPAVPAVNYCRRLSLARLLQASGPFSLRPNADETTAPQFGFRGHPALFFRHTTSYDRGLISTRLLFFVKRVAGESTRAVPFRSESPELASSHVPGLQRLPVRRNRTPLS